MKDNAFAPLLSAAEAEPELFRQRVLVVLGLRVLRVLPNANAQLFKARISDSHSCL
jgi:hypothetical protein